MRISRVLIAALSAFAFFAGAVSASAATPAEIAAHRQESLDEMLTERFQPSLVANARRSCALGLEPAHVAESRAGGAYFTPDAADGCVTALIRTARDRHLPELYGRLAVEMGGSATGSDNLPRVIGAAVLSGDGKAAIGNGKVAVVTPALAFDAGFAVAYQDGNASKPASVDAAKLKALADSCLGQHQDAGTCFSAGYAYGARAFHGQTISVR
jgi:hypothetical protein